MNIGSNLFVIYRCIEGMYCRNAKQAVSRMSFVTKCSKNMHYEQTNNNNNNNKKKMTLLQLTASFDSDQPCKALPPQKEIVPPQFS